MGQFKPMVKMMTTEPTVELKLKKGGSVKKAMGGMMGSPMASSMPARGGMMPVKSPMKPTMAARRAAMMGMKEGGMSCGMKEGGKADMAQDKAMIKKAFKQHDMQEHANGKGTKLTLKKGGKAMTCATGGIAKSTKPGGYATGGVVNGQGGYKKGGKVKMATGGVAKSGIINTEDEGGEYRNTKMDTTKPDNNSAPTGGVKLGNGGGYKKGGATKKRYATGGAVNNSGHAVAYPAKKPSAPVSNDRQSGTFKKGGSVTPSQKKEQSAFKGENTMSMKQAKAYSNEKYGRKMQAGGALTDASKGAYDKSIGPSDDDMEIAKVIRNIPSKLYEGAKSLFGGKAEKPAGSVTKTEKSVTVAPPKKRGGAVKC